MTGFERGLLSVLKAGDSYTIWAVAFPLFQTVVFLHCIDFIIKVELDFEALQNT